MAYRMVQLPMTLSEAEGHFCCFKICNTHNSGNIACYNYSVFTHKVESARDLIFIDKGEELLKITGSHVHWKSDNISERVLDGDVVTTGH